VLFLLDVGQATSQIPKHIATPYQITPVPPEETVIYYFAEEFNSFSVGREYPKSLVSIVNVHSHSFYPSRLSLTTHPEVVP